MSNKDPDMVMSVAEFQVRRAIEDNSKIIFLISQ